MTLIGQQRQRLALQHPKTISLTRRLVDVESADDDGEVAAIAGRERPLHRHAGEEVATLPRSVAVLQMFLGDVEEQRLLGAGLAVAQQEFGRLALARETDQLQTGDVVLDDQQGAVLLLAARREGDAQLGLRSRRQEDHDALL